MIKLNKSAVVFDSESHRYLYGEQRLMGITGLIHEVLDLGKYEEATDYVKRVMVPLAGARGTCVHHAIQTYDELGVEDSIRIMYCHDGIERGEPRDRWSFVQEEGCKSERVFDVSNELRNYISMRRGFTPVEGGNEYTVTDGYWASQIDNVYTDANGDIWLCDTKTNNLAYYPKCGYGCKEYFATPTDALKEYLSWQLSIYAVLFEAQNPHLKVKGLMCHWLRDDKCEQWQITRKDDALVRNLLTARYDSESESNVRYTHEDVASLYPSALPAAVQNDVALLAKDKIEQLATTLKLAAEYKAMADAMRDELRAAMDNHGYKSWDAGCFKATFGKDTTTKSFDLDRFKKDYPELAAQYMVEKEKKGAFTIKLR